ncbi:MAG TPA: hypothetical protein VNZ49_14660 [Bacteroidia bacterium]|jgi:hypothetical protein|nr:hypothetical protein [Bacteroidia bacterium]
MADIPLPNFSKKFFCVVDRKNPVLAAIISSYLYTPGEYIPMFEFSFTGVSKTETNKDELEKHVISGVAANEFSTRIRNILAELKGCEYLIIAGLDANQRSYLEFANKYNLIEINTVDDVDLYLNDIIEKAGTVTCNDQDIHNGLYKAAKTNSILKLDPATPDIVIETEGEEGIIVIENDNSACSVIAVNYALAFNAFISTIKPPKTDRKEIKYLIEKLYEEKDDRYFNDLSTLLYPAVENIKFENYRYGTFFTFGAPYSLILKNIIPFTHVNNSLDPDFFIFNGLLAEKRNSFHSAIVFSPLEFGTDEETSFLINKLSEKNYYVKELVGKDASAYNIDNHVKEFPYEILHFCSHGGEVSGYSVVQEFTDRDGNKHTVEYDEVVSFAPSKYEKLIPVTSKYIYRKFDGLEWRSKELKAKNIPQHVFVDMNKIIGKIEKHQRKRKEVIPDSCAIKCSDFNYQAMFNMIAGMYSSPFVFNNTCWSWSDISHSFLGVGARAYIGTLWEVGNKVARTVAETFYTEVFGNTILDALQKSLAHTKGNSNENIYVLWGLHFSTIKSGNSIRESRMSVAKKLLGSFYRWRNHIKGVQDEWTKEDINRLIEWNYNQLLQYFFTESLVLIGMMKQKQI